MPLVAIIATLPAWAAEDPIQILKRFIAADKNNARAAGQYTYVEHAEYFNFDKSGKVTGDRSETHEIVFVEGGEYRKLVLRNDKPLEAKEQAKEDKRMQQTAEERRRQRHSGLFNKTISLGSYDDLLTMFDNRLIGEEEVRGHKTWVIQSTPKAGQVRSTAHEKDVLSFQEKLWIDVNEYQLVKKVYTVVDPHVDLAPGTTLSWDSEKVNNDVWLVTSGVIDGHMQIAKFIKPAVRTEYKNSRFQKFDVQSTITMDTVK
ncbi:MAG: outer membrane lipoprotein-sorting protein [Acidobacteriota bacterium]|nr:outer membrane lipoprotein-sorting protein [Acidobacteriota bacterium]